MQLSEREEFSVMLQEMAAMYRGTIYNDFFANAYWKVLKLYSMDAVRRACLDLMGNEMRKNVIPSAPEIKSVARRYEPIRKPFRVDQDEERWRRRYDVWQGGGFSNEALAASFLMNDTELGMGAEGEDTYLTCQMPGCSRRVPWPSDDGEMFCQNHRETHGKPVTRGEKIEIARALTPKGRAFLRAALPGLMADIPPTPEELVLQEVPPRDIPAKLVEYLKTVDSATASEILANYQEGRGKSVDDEQLARARAAGLEV